MATLLSTPAWFESFERIRLALKEDPFWSKKLGYLGDILPSVGVHLGVFVEPFLAFVLEGTKTVESRFSANRCAPYNKVQVGDAILLKKSGGPILGIVNVDAVWSYTLDESSWHGIREEFSKALCAQDPKFWAQRKHANYATLMAINHVAAIDPVDWKKRDRRGWIVLQPAKKTPIGNTDE